MKFVPPNNPILTKVAKKIPKNQINSTEIKKIVKAMLKVAHGQRKNKKRPIMVGVAAPQIGKSIRIILVDIKADGKGKVGSLKVYINPEIIWSSKKKVEWYEGCFSTGKVCGIVKRPVSIKVRAYKVRPYTIVQGETLQAQLIEEEYSGYVARIFQHEIDHLNGRVFVDLIKNPDYLHWVKKNEFPLYRNRGAWKNWPKKYPLPLA